MTFIDFFAGIGGFRMGMELAGHKCLGFCEFDKHAVMSYTAMHLCTDEQIEHLKTLPFEERQEEILKEEYKNDDWYADDVRRVYAGDIPKADCWCFGFPCQDISIANTTANHAGLQGNRSSLFYRVMYMVGQLQEEDKPTYLLIENVKNLLAVNGGWDFARLLSEMDGGGYDVEWNVLNSKHFGVAQNRERCFVVGHLRSSETRRVFPLVATSTGVLKSVQCDASGRGMNSQQDRFYETDGIMCCLPNARANTKCTVFIDGTPHILTAKERLRLQGFDDPRIDKAYLVNTPYELSRQAGNSVTVTVVQAIAEKMIRIWKEDHDAIQETETDSV